jgi:adenylosuccinate synthase
MARHVVVVGIQWGDEGKGRVVDLLASSYDAVIRFQGGNNAGHTVVDDFGRTIKLRLIPSGITRQGVLCVIGNGLVVNPIELLGEINELRSAGVEISPKNLLIAENTPLLLPVQVELDRLLEAASGKNKIGTTGRGIGPAYEDQTGRRSIRVCDLADETYLSDRLTALLFYHNALRRGLGMSEYSMSDLRAPLRDIAPIILPYAAPVWRILRDMDRAGKRFLFEGAQGTMLDCDHGTFPFVTSSNTLAAQAAIGSGFPGAAKSAYVLGVVKAYTTRVGGGPFPAELHDETGTRMRQRGGEFGTNTGRPRRCGWFDAALVRQAVQQNGVDGLVLTKLDVLDGSRELKMCVGYNAGGKSYDYLPASPGIQATCEPVYESAPGWEESTEGVRDLDRLPVAALNYIRAVEQLVGVPVLLASTSPKRSDIVVVRNHEILRGRVQQTVLDWGGSPLPTRQ